MTTLKAQTKAVSAADAEVRAAANATVKAVLEFLYNRSAGGGVPTGTIIAWPGETPPDGYTVADGRALSRTTYAALFAVYGTKYGSGDGSTTFNVPNLAGRYIQYVTDGGQVGQMLEAGLPNITGRFGVCGYHETGWNSAVSEANNAFYRDDSCGDGNPGSNGGWGGYAFDASRISDLYGSSSTIRPSTIVLLACVKL